MQHEQALGWPTKPIAGIDEAGRGSWCGPVVAAAAVLPADFNIDGLADSKKLPAARRETLFVTLQAIPHGIGCASVAEIDKLNILQASFLAMQRAVYALSARHPHMRLAHILIDGNQLPNSSYELPCAASALIGGDNLSPTIAAASILAKVTRDHIMVVLDSEHPGYHWASNKGYGVKTHREGLAKLGITPHHRKTYAPIRNILRASGV